VIRIKNNHQPDSFRLIVNKLKIVLILAIGFSSPYIANGQAYITSGGIRFGTELGLTIQQKIPGTNTIEGIVTTNKYRWQVQGLFEHHRRLLGKRLNYYYGIGPHWGDEKAYGKYFGITPVTGVEFTIAKLTISYDYKPSFNIKGGSSFIFHDSGLSVRAVIIRKTRKHPIKDWFEKI
jgi:hypothetical protein